MGQAQGGPAKVAVLSSGLMGTISGSGVANVLTVGQFTIPLMKRFGYTSVFAGAAEATASMGGQIMPPVSGRCGIYYGRDIEFLCRNCQGSHHSSCSLLCNGFLMQYLKQVV